MVNSNIPNIQRNLRHNFIVNILDGGFFGFAIGFASFTTILPLFVSTMTSSAILIGLVPAIHNMGWQFPQLLTARRISSLKRLKPFVLILTIQERLPFLGLAAIAWFLPALGFQLGLILTFLMLIWQGLGAGFTANGWQNLVSKVIPAENRATFFGTQSAAANLLASLGAVAGGFILENASNEKGFAYCFLIAVFLFVVSWVFLRMTREPDSVALLDNNQDISLVKNIGLILRNDKPFLGFLISRTLSQFGMMAFAFYVVYAVRVHNMSETTAGILTGVLFITQVVANPILGWIADHWSHRIVLAAGAICGSLSALLAWLSPGLSWFAVIMVLTGIANTAFWTIGLAFSLDFGNDSNRPTYVGMANTFIAPSAILAPLVGGFLADQAGYSLTFITSAILSLLAAAALFILVKKPNPKSA
jgi:MFS family permease